MVNGKKRVKINALLDIGSNITILTNRVLKALAIQNAVNYDWSVGGVGESNTEHEGYHLDTIHILSEENVQLTVQDVVTTDKLTDVRAIDWTNLQGKLVAGANNTPIKILKPAGNGAIDMLIGTNNADLWLFKDHIHRKDVIAVKTVLGWSVVKVQTNKSEDLQSHLATFPPQAEVTESISDPEFDSELREATSSRFSHMAKLYTERKKKGSQ